MNNIGLKKHSRNLERSLPIGNSYINLFRYENNLILNIPLVSMLNLSYIYNHIEKYNKGSMGYGGNISIYKKIDTKHCKDYGTCEVINADF